MLIIILCGDGYCYMRAWMCGSVSRETIGKGRGEEGEREKYGVWGLGLCVRNVLFPCNIAFPLYQNNIKNPLHHIFWGLLYCFTVIYNIIYIMQ